MNGVVGSTFKPSHAPATSLVSHPHYLTHLLQAVGELQQQTLIRKDVARKLYISFDIHAFSNICATLAVERNKITKQSSDLQSQPISNSNSLPRSIPYCHTLMKNI